MSQLNCYKFKVMDCIWIFFWDFIMCFKDTFCPSLKLALLVLNINIFICINLIYFIFIFPSYKNDSDENDFGVMSSSPVLYVSMNSIYQCYSFSGYFPGNCPDLAASAACQIR